MSETSENSTPPEVATLREPAPSQAVQATIDTAEALELIFGLVGPTGVDLSLVCDLLKAELRSMDYEAEVISLSDLIASYMKAPNEYENGYQRIDSLMNMGTYLKGQTKQADIVARLAVGSIRALRKIKNETGKARLGRAYIIRSFKLPEEVALFREIYGEQFFLVSVYASKLSRVDYLKRYIGPTLKTKNADVHELAHRLIKRDYEEEDVLHGQQVAKTFPLADYFVNSEQRQQLGRELRRLVQLVFGHPYISPGKDEQSMFFAQAAGFRSLDLSRQVGAAIVDGDGAVIVTGCNDVAKPGGGLYWEDEDNPKRDFEFGYDANVILKKHIVEDVLVRLRSAGWLSESVTELNTGDLVKDAIARNGANLKRSTLYDVIEFGRAVHAEMAAISSAARDGKSLRGSRLFCTTFPCHICARHIVAAGVSEVLFIEPYEKSRVAQLFFDSIEIEPVASSPERIAFRAFVGVAPRRYMDFFRSRGSKKSEDGGVFPASHIGMYKQFTKKTFHISLLEAYTVKQAAPAPPWPRVLTGD